MADKHPNWLAAAKASETASLPSNEGELLQGDFELRLFDAIYTTPATTLEGVRAQIAAVLFAQDVGMVELDGEAAALRNAVFTLDALLAEGRA